MAPAGTEARLRVRDNVIRFVEAFHREVQVRDVGALLRLAQMRQPPLAGTAH